MAFPILRRRLGTTLNLDYDISRALTLSSVTALTATRGGEAGWTGAVGHRILRRSCQSPPEKFFSQDARDQQL